MSGKNSYGATVTNYWLYYYYPETEEFECWGAYYDLDMEEYSDYVDRIETLHNNTGKELIINTATSRNKLSRDSVKRINKFFEDDILDEIKPLDVKYKTAD